MTVSDDFSGRVTSGVGSLVGSVSACVVAVGSGCFGGSDASLNDLWEATPAGFSVNGAGDSSTYWTFISVIVDSSMTVIAEPSDSFEGEVLGLSVDFDVGVMGGSGSSSTALLTDWVFSDTGFFTFLPLGAIPDFFIVFSPGLDSDIIRTSILMFHGFSVLLIYIRHTGPGWPGYICHTG